MGAAEGDQLDGQYRDSSARQDGEEKAKQITLMGEGEGHRWHPAFILFADALQVAFDPKRVGFSSVFPMGLTIMSPLCYHMVRGRAAW